MYQYKTIPSSVVKVGHLISLWRVLDEGISFHAGKFWNITSGAHSICMLPTITDISSHKMVKKRFNLKRQVPKNLSEHWELFVDIANHPNFLQPWKASLLFFPKIWFNHKNDKRWVPFYYFLINTLLQISVFRRNQFIIDFAFSLAQENCNLRPNP